MLILHDSITELGDRRVEGSRSGVEGGQPVEVLVQHAGCGRQPVDGAQHGTVGVGRGNWSTNPARNWTARVVRSALAGEVAKAAADAGLDGRLIGLVKLRASQLNGCAYCLDMHSADTLREGEDQRRLHVLAAWRETDLFTEQERVALELTEAMTRLVDTKDVPQDVHERATGVFTEAQYQAVMWVIIVNNRIAIPGHTALPKRAA